LPGHEGKIECRSEVAWTDGAGRAGIRFKEMSDATKQKLEGWLEEQMARLEAQENSRPTQN
jgi:hypothetical protein